MNMLTESAAKWFVLLFLTNLMGLISAGKVRTKRALHLVERGKSFQEKILETTNEERAKHGVGALQWDNGLENTATQWAKHLAAEDKFYHSNAGDKGLGENLYYAFGWPEGKVPKLAVEKWYDEIKDYDFNNPTFGHSTGHFTQLVWKDTKKVGCGMAKSSAGNMYVCCNYSPPGNYQGEFEENVPRPL